MAAISKCRSSVQSSLIDRSCRKITRWYLMLYPYGRKGLTLGLDREIERRKREGEQLFEYFAPTYVEAKEIDGKLVTSKTPLLYNYFFIHANEDEIFKIKKYQPQYNLLHRVSNADGSYYYPYVQDSVIQNLKWIAKSYEGCIPLCLLDQTLLVKGDRIKITKGQLKGVEAYIVTRPKSATKEIMVFVDNWLCVPLMRVRPNQYEVIGLNDKQKSSKKLDNPCLSQNLHEALCRFHLGGTTEEDRKLASDTLRQFATVEVDSAILRCKLYSFLLPAYTILENKDKYEGVLKLIHILLPKIKAEQSLALLMVTLYGCTNNSVYHEKAHQLIDPWANENSPKKSKQLLIQCLADYDECLGHQFNESI